VPGCRAAAAAAEREEEEEEGELSQADFGLSLIGVCCSRPLRRCSMRNRMRQCVSAYVSMCQHVSAYVSIRLHTSAYVCIRLHTSAYVSIRQHTSHTSAYVSIRARASVAAGVHRGAAATADVNMRPHTSAYAAATEPPLFATNADAC
jgi:hypothetical protein